MLFSYSVFVINMTFCFLTRRICTTFNYSSFESNSNILRRLVTIIFLISFSTFDSTTLNELRSNSFSLLLCSFKTLTSVSISFETLNSISISLLLLSSKTLNSNSFSMFFFSLLSFSMFFFSLFFFSTFFFSMKFSSLLISFVSLILESYFKSNESLNLSLNMKLFWLNRDILNDFRFSI